MDRYDLAKAFAEELNEILGPGVVRRARRRQCCRRRFLILKGPVAKPVAKKRKGKK